MTIADQLIVLNGGKIAQQGTPAELYRTPVNTFVAGFIGSPSTNLVDGEIRAGVFTADGLEWPAPGGPGGPVTFGVRPEDLIVEPDAGGDARVELVELLGPRYVVLVRAGARRLTAVVEESVVAGWSDVPKPGDPVRVRVRPGREHLFDAATGTRLAQ